MKTSGAMGCLRPLDRPEDTELSLVEAAALLRRSQYWMELNWEHMFAAALVNDNHYEPRFSSRTLLHVVEMMMAEDLWDENWDAEWNE